MSSLPATRGGRGRCAACGHPDAAQIDKDLAAGSKSLRSLAGVYRISHKALAAHQKNHLAKTLVALQRSAGTGTVMEQFQRLLGSALRQLATAEASGNSHTALTAIRETRETLLIIAKATGTMRPEPVVIDVATLPEIVNMRAKMIKALAPFPEARLACAAVLNIEDDA